MDLLPPNNVFRQQFFIEFGKYPEEVYDILREETKAKEPGDMVLMLLSMSQVCHRPIGHNGLVSGLIHRLNVDRSDRRAGERMDKIQNETVQRCRCCWVCFSVLSLLILL